MIVLTLRSLVVSAGVLVSVASTPPPRQRSDFRNDARFAERVRLAGSSGELRSLAAAIGRAAGVPLVDHDIVRPGAPPPDGNLVLQPGLGSLRVGAAGEAAAVELLEGLEAVTGARWRPARGSWVLTTVPGAEDFCVLTAEQQAARRHQSTAHAATLTPGQLQLLRSRGELRPQDLNESQRRWLADSARAAYVNSYPEIAVEALQLNGVCLRMVRFRDGTLSDSVDFVFPVTTGDPAGGAFMLIHERDLRINPTGPPPGPPPRPAPTEPARTGSNPREPAALDKDDRLQATVRLSKRGLLDAAVQAAEAAKVSVLLSTQYHRRIVTLGRPEATAAEVLETVAELAGGTWERVGSLYVLRPDPTLERLALLLPEARQARIKEAAGPLLKHLTSPQRRALLAGGKVTPEQMTRQQRQPWQWIASLGFAEKSHVPRSAVALENSWIQAVQDPGGVKQAQFVCRSSTGAAILIAAVPFD